MAADVATLQSGNALYNPIPPGRENDYREIAAPTVDFLDMVVDKANMYIGPLPITNGSEDRDGEVTNPDGLIDVAYKSNPIVFLQHSHRIAPMIPPIGTSETPQRVYDVKRIGDVWYSGCRFSQSTRFARQVFRMVDDGLIRGRSIGALNHAMSYYKPKLPGVAFHQNQIIPVRTKSVSHDQYELVEWSHVFLPSNRDIVTPLKSIMSKGWIDDRPISTPLKMIMKSLDLSEPASNAKYIAQNPRFKWPDFLGGITVKSPATLLFRADAFTAKRVKEFMADNADVGIIETEIETETIGGDLYLKSTQFKHAGQFEVSEHPAVPGMRLLFAKAEAATEKIEQLVANDAAGSVQVVEKPAPEQAVAKAPEKAADIPAPVPEAGAEATAVENAEAVENAAGPGGMRYLKALVKNATTLAEMMEAASAEQEPEMLEKCGEFTTKVRGLIKEVSDFEAERYGKNKPNEAAEAESEKPTAELTKAAKSGLFYGTKSLVPGSFMNGLQLLKKEVKDESCQQVIGAMMKGLAVPEAKPDPEQALRDKVRAMLVREKASAAINQLV